MDKVQKIVGDFRDRNIVDIEFIPFDKEQKKVKRTLEIIEFYLVSFAAGHKLKKSRLHGIAETGTNIVTLPRGD